LTHTTVPIPTLSDLAVNKELVAFCLVGHPRQFGLDIAQKMKRNVINAFFPAAHNFVFALPVMSGMNTKSDFSPACRNGKCNNDVIFTGSTDADDIADALEYLRAVQVGFVYDTCQDHSCSPRILNCSGYSMSQGTFQMTRWKGCSSMISAFERKNEVVFDWVWKLRFDLVFNHPVPHVSILDSQFVYATNMNWMFDMVLAVPRKYMHVVFNAVDLIQCRYCYDFNNRTVSDHMCSDTQCGTENLLVGLLRHLKIFVDALPWCDTACDKSKFRSVIIARWNV
jgi:hypothetical protein